MSRRCRRRRIVEHVLTLAWISPFRCAACGFRFLAFHPGVRYRRRRVQRRARERFAIGGPCVVEYEGERIAGQAVDLDQAARSRLGTAVLAARGYASDFIGGGRRRSRSRRRGARWRIVAAALIAAALALVYVR